MARFRDIPQFPHSSYSVTIDWTRLEENIERQTEMRHGAGALDLNPDFQRAHVWTPAQQSAYVEYILRGGTSGRDLYFNCPGWMGDFRGPYVIVDGKQRIEAVRAFLRDEVPAFGFKYSEFSDSPRFTTACFTWHVASVETRAEVLEWYLAFNAGGSVHSQEELDRVRALLQQERAGASK